MTCCLSQISSFAMAEVVVYEAVAVHDFKEYVQGCANVLDEEWTRSASARSVLEVLKEGNSQVY